MDHDLSLSSGPVVGILCQDLGYGSKERDSPRKMTSFTRRVINFRKCFEDRSDIVPGVELDSEAFQKCAKEFVKENSNLFEDSEDARIWGWPFIPRDYDRIIQTLAKLISTQYQYCERNSKHKNADRGKYRDSHENYDQDFEERPPNYDDNDQQLEEITMEEAISSHESPKVQNEPSSTSPVAKKTFSRIQHSQYNSNQCPTEEYHRDPPLSSLTPERASLPRKNSKRYHSIEWDDGVYDRYSPVNSAKKKRKSVSASKSKDASFSSPAKKKASKNPRPFNNAAPPEQYRALQAHMGDKLGTNFFDLQSANSPSAAIPSLEKSPAFTISENSQILQETLDALEQIQDDPQDIALAGPTRVRVLENIKSPSANHEANIAGLTTMATSAETSTVPTVPAVKETGLLPPKTSEKPQLKVILDDWEHGLDNPLSWSKYVRKASLEDFFTLVCEKTGMKPEKVHDLVLRYSWKTGHKLSAHVLMTQKEWVRLKKNIDMKFEIAKENFPLETEFQIWVTCANVQVEDEEEEEEED